jgi:hypothetical protein
VGDVVRHFSLGVELVFLRTRHRRQRSPTLRLASATQLALAGLRSSLAIDSAAVAEDREKLPG